MKEAFYIALLDWVTDHYKHFKCFPMEFEFENKVYDLSEFIEGVGRIK